MFALYSESQKRAYTLYKYEFRLILIYVYFFTSNMYSYTIHIFYATYVHELLNKFHAFEVYTHFCFLLYTN